MAKNITTKTTIENLAAELKKTFAKKSDLVPISDAAVSAFKHGKVTGNRVELFTSPDGTGSAAFSFDFPKEYFLDQTKSQFVQSFAFSSETYPGAVNPSLEGKPVMVLAVKSGDGVSSTFSFVDLTYLLNTYQPKTGDSTATVTIDNYDISVNVNISAESENALIKKSDGLFVPKAVAVDISGKADKVSDAVEGNIASLGASGNLVDSGVSASKLVTSDDISDYTAAEIASLLTDESTVQ